MSQLELGQGEGSPDQIKEGLNSYQDALIQFYLNERKRLLSAFIKFVLIAGNLNLI
jgi:hypothetical protein